MWNPSLIAVAKAYEYGPEEIDPETGETFKPIVGELPGLRLNVDNRLRCAEVEPYVINPNKILLDFGGPKVSFKLFFPDGEEQALAIVGNLPNWTVSESEES